jgi:hypothetical protein
MMRFCSSSENVRSTSHVRIVSLMSRLMAALWVDVAGSNVTRDGWWSIAVPPRDITFENGVSLVAVLLADVNDLGLSSVVEFIGRLFPDPACGTVVVQTRIRHGL